MNTFAEVADKNLLAGRRKEIFVTYMRERWGDEESSMCATGYASEWAQRFFHGREYQASDITGQCILDRLYA